VTTTKQLDGLTFPLSLLHRSKLRDYFQGWPPATKSTVFGFRKLESMQLVLDNGLLAFVEGDPQ
jgi:hypothetical protein